MDWNAEVINLDGHYKIRLKYGIYLAGYFRTLDEVERHLAKHGATMAELRLT